VTTNPLPLSGTAAASTLTRILAQVGAHLSYLKAEVGPVDYTRSEGATSPVQDGQWMSCQELVTDATWLGKVIQGTGQAIGTTDQTVAASIFIQGYAYRIATLAVACLTIGGAVPGSTPDAVAVGLGRGRVSKVAYLEPTLIEVLAGAPGEELASPSVADRALTLILDQVVEGHLRPLIATTRSHVRIGERLLWGNVAASVSTAFRTMEGCLGQWVVPLGQRFFELAPPEMQGLGSFLSIESRDGRGWFWERTNCCLFYQIEGHAKCADCSLTPAAERRDAYRAAMSG
jgi:iron complex transport system ATP-binding protein